MALCPQALANSTEVEVIDEKVRCKVDPERWPIPTPVTVGSPRTDFSQLIHCPEFVPGKVFIPLNTGESCSSLPTLHNPGEVWGSTSSNTGTITTTLHLADGSILSGTRWDSHLEPLDLQ